MNGLKFNMMMERETGILDELDSLKIGKRVNWVVSVLSFLIEG